MQNKQCPHLKSVLESPLTEAEVNDDSTKTYSGPQYHSHGLKWDHRGTQLSHLGIILSTP
jgi:hypothetical protein